MAECNWCDPAPSVAMVGNDEARAQVILKAANEAVDTGLARAEADDRAAVANETFDQVKEFQELLGEPLPEFGDNNATVLVRLQQRVEAFIDE